MRWWPLIVLVEGARRNVPVQYAARRVGQRLLPQRSQVLPIKLNSAGFLIPATVTPWILYLPLALATFVFGQTPWLAAAYEQVQFARPGHMIVGSIAVFVLVFIYTAYVLDPERAAETLRQRDGAIPDVAPGAAHRRLSRSRRVVDDGRRSRLPRRHIADTGSPGGIRRAAVLFWWWVGADCGLHYP